MGTRRASQEEANMAGDELIIEITDEDGFTTRWPWPNDKSLLANGSFVSIYERWHEELKREALAPSA
jgi:hypothetical protein